MTGAESSKLSPVFFLSLAGTGAYAAALEVQPRGVPRYRLRPSWRHPVLENRAVRLERAAGSPWLAGLGDQIAFIPWRRGQPNSLDDLPGTMAQIADDDAPSS